MERDRRGERGRGVVFSPKLVGSCFELVTDPDGRINYKTGTRIVFLNKIISMESENKRCKEGVEDGEDWSQ